VGNAAADVPVNREIPPANPAALGAPSTCGSLAARLMAPLALLSLGLASAFRPTLSSAFRLVQTDQGDTRLVNFILEHSYRWAVGWATFRPLNLWDQPIFFPTTNVAAYSEVLLGSAPIYWLFRALRFGPDTSLQLWMIAILALNFVTMHLFMRNCLGFRPLASAVGAFLFAFAGPRVTQMGHQQLLPQFFTILALYGLFRAFEPRRLGARQGIYLFFFASAAQLWAAFYLGWFLFFALLLVGICALSARSHRERLGQFLATHRATIATAALASLVLVTPMILHYLKAFRLVGPRPFSAAALMTPPLQSWFYLGPDSWLYSWQQRFKLFTTITMANEQRMGIGWITLPLAVIGLYRFSKDRGGWVRPTALAAVVAVLLVTRYPGGFMPWRIVFHVIPAANAIRAVSRVILLMVVPLSIGLGYLVHTRRSIAAGLLIGAICFLEQGRTTDAYDKLEVRNDVSAIASRLSKACDTFYYARFYGSNAANVYPQYKLQIDAVWASAETGIPTINGYSGNSPIGWGELWENKIADEPGRLRLQEAVRRWSSEQRLDPAKVCWIELAR
jgi:hypothetical protein